MCKKVSLALLFAMVSVALSAQQRLFNETPQQKARRMAWWTHDRFGMFIHWGLYALPARHEWVKRWERLNDTQYQPYFNLFNPDMFDAKTWAKAAKAAGMKYAVLTTKHHEGFCLFDSRYTAYKATNTPAKRDLVKEFVEAFRAEGIKVGFYYSLLDWHHPDFTIDVLHPQQPANDADTAYARLNKGRDMARYRQYMRNQVTELLTRYGTIDIMWLDFSYPGNKGHGKSKDDWGSVELLKLIRKLQPGIIVDNRLDLGAYEDGEDFLTPEQVKVEELDQYKGKTWETCQTFSGSWGYYRDEDTWKTHKQLLALLVGAVSKGGNLILNVGPTARGVFDARATKALDSLSYWMKYNNRSIYGCTYAPAGFPTPANTMLSYNAVTKRLYIHLFEYPGIALTLPGYAGKIKYAQFLHDNSEIRCKPSEAGTGDIILNLPVKKPGFEVPVIELVLQ
jgi:alpha-L-fucosidase